jgi:tRNA pseudouridine38-40 synthase
MKNIKLTVAYDGKGYLGWQKTKMGSSIEGVLQGVLEQIFQVSVKLQAASRTDAGVHARGQIVNFLVDVENLDTSSLLISLNRLLPNDIAVTLVDVASQNFHPTLDCYHKEYRYYICNSRWQYPENRYYSWHYPSLLNRELMREAAQPLIGTNDFAAFTNVAQNEQYEDHTRTIYDITIESLPDQRLCICVKGVTFLYKMVRNIVGTIVTVGHGKRGVQDVERILRSKQRVEAGMTAPAHGLFLHQISYE